MILLAFLHYAAISVETGTISLSVVILDPIAWSKVSSSLVPLGLWPIYVGVKRIVDICVLRSASVAILFQGFLMESLLD